MGVGIDDPWCRVVELSGQKPPQVVHWLLVSKAVDICEV